MTQQQKAEHMAQWMVNQARGAAVRYDAAKNAAKDVKTTGGSVKIRVTEKFKTQYGKKDKMAQSSERKTLGRRSSTKDGSKPTGYESPKEFRDKSMPLRKFRDRFQSEALRSSILSDRKAMKSIQDNDKKNKEQDMRMKHGKSWKDYRKDSGEKPLRKGEVRRYDKAKGKYVSNMD